MTATSHAVIGTIIATKIGNPVLAIPIAIASHFLADIVPHWDTGTNHKEKNTTRFIIESFIDVTFSFILSFILINLFFPTTSISYAFFIIIISQLPDWITAPYLFFKVKIPLFVWTYHFQRKFNNRLDKPWGIITQVAVLILLIIIAKTS